MRYKVIIKTEEKNYNNECNEYYANHKNDDIDEQWREAISLSNDDFEIIGRAFNCKSNKIVDNTIFKLFENTFHNLKIDEDYNKFCIFLNALMNPNSVPTSYTIEYLLTFTSVIYDVYLFNDIDDIKVLCNIHYVIKKIIEIFIEY